MILLGMGHVEWGKGKCKVNEVRGIGTFGGVPHTGPVRQHDLIVYDDEFLKCCNDDFEFNL